MLTSEGEARPTWIVNIAPPSEEKNAAMAKMNALNSAGSYPENLTRSSRSLIATRTLPSRLFRIKLPATTHMSKAHK